VKKTRYIAAAAVAACAALASPALASAAKLSPLKLDSHDSDDGHYAGPAKGPTLAAGTWYVVKVDGTISYYSKAIWQSPEDLAPYTQLCGSPDPRPAYPSKDKAGNNLPDQYRVGMDAETVFARPCYLDASGAAAPKLGHWDNFQVSADGGITWHHPNTLSGRLSTWTADNAYSYAVLGQGKPVQFRLKDIPGTADNYGRLNIAFRVADGSDCSADGWDHYMWFTGFGATSAFPTLGDCLSGLSANATVAAARSAKATAGK
jgi:hypothetical protein